MVRHALALFVALLMGTTLCGARPAHYLVIHEDAHGALSVAFHAVVEVDGIAQLAPTDAWDGNGSRFERRLSARLATASGVVFDTDVVTASELRGEFQSAGTPTIDGHHIETTTHDYVLRVPALTEPSRALLYSPRVLKPIAGAAALPPPPQGPPAALEITLDPVTPGKVAKASSPDAFAIRASGKPSNRIDVLVIAEGYTADQRAKFVQDAHDTVTRFFGISPYSEYPGAFNFTGLFLASNQSGASKPACPETPGSPVVSVDTALKSTYCTSGIRRLLSVDYNLMYAAASAVPDWDTIFVLVNDTEYGGSGGAASVVSLNSASYMIAQHEFQHTFSRLADEYSDPYPGYAACTDVDGTNRPCEPNVTDRLSPVKWAAWFDPGTPVPTVNAPSDRRAAGAWEGARYLTSGMYRQCYSGIMRALGEGFCKVDTDAFVTRIYSGGWGVPSGGLSIIEPDSTSPPATTSVTTGTVVTLHATLAGPSAFDTAWTVDGTVVQQGRAGNGAVSYDFTATAGTHAVRLVASDFTHYTLVPRAGEVVWNIAGTAPPTFTLSVSRTGTAGGSVSSNPAGIDCGATCSASFASGALVSLTATAAANAVFAGWSGACGGTGVCAVTMNGPLAASARFDPAPGKLSFDPASVDFGAQSMHTTSPAQKIKITNVGSSPLDASAIAAGGGFDVTHDCGTLAPAQSCTASVTFTPPTDGAMSGALTITTSVSTYTVALTGAGEKSLVTHYYRSILGRAPDNGGKSFWEGEAARVAGLGANVNEVWYDMAGAFFTSAEYLASPHDNAAFVQNLYLTFFNRAADASGLGYWKDQLDQGLPREVALAAFMFSPEFASFTQGIFGNTAVRKEVDMVMDFYRGLLARLPDNGGFGFWLQRFRTAQCAGASALTTEVDSISAQFLASPEYAARSRDDAQYVGDLYNAFLRRGGDLDGVKFWLGQLSTHAQTREELRRAFVSSPEFQARVDGIAKESCVPQ